MILVTGANGFVGRRLVSVLTEHGRAVRCAVRAAAVADAVAVGDIGPDTDWSAALAGVKCLVHTAARVHVMNDRAVDPLAAFREVNVAGTLNLARQAAGAGVRRFIFLSTIKVNGEETSFHSIHKTGLEEVNRFTENDLFTPVDPYGVSKWEAEQGLLSLAAETSLEVVIIRPPLVYGPGVKGNFLAMMRWLHKGIPLPFGAIDNRRSLVALDNLVDLIVTCLDHPAAANQVFLAGDGEDLSTTVLLRRLGKALNKPARLLPVPAWLLERAAPIVGQRAVGQRLCGSLQVDISKARTRLGWTPPVSVDEALQKTAQAYLQDPEQS